MSIKRIMKQQQLIYWCMNQNRVYLKCKVSLSAASLICCLLLEIDQKERKKETESSTADSQTIEHYQGDEQSNQKGGEQ